MTLNLFYEEPDPDRWLALDRYPRRLVRRMLRGAPRPGGQTVVFLNLCAGLGKLGMKYRVNDFDYSMRHPGELACIIGKPFLLDRIRWQNPILFGASVFSHPLDDPDLLERLPVKRVLVPGEWLRRMWEPYYGDRVTVWPVGIDTHLWQPSGEKTIDVLLYDKVRWEHERYDRSLIEPVRESLRVRGRSFAEIRYGFYREIEFRNLLSKCRAMVFLCEHETQGLAYQQALSCGVPVFAWDRGGPWRDPAYFPDKVVYGPVTSVPYWDDRCGARFPDAEEFDNAWGAFWDQVNAGRFRPRDYILENLTLEKCARRYCEIAREIHEENPP